MSGCVVNDLSEAADMLADILEDEDIALIRIPAGCTETELEAVIEELVYEKGVNFSTAGVHMNILCVEQ
jgi:hypothetical protein